MLVLLHTLLGAALGFAAGWVVGLVFQWPEAAQTGAVCGCVGQVCRAALAWVSRPSDETAVYQSRITTWPVLACICCGIAAVAWLLRFPATVVVPAASYLLVRLLLSWQHRGPGALNGTALRVAARGGELITLLAAILTAREPLL